MTQIVVNIIDPSSPVEVKYDIFRRINTGGRPLNAQEIRNCLAKPQTRDLLNSMSHHPAFIDTTLGSIKNARMEAQEMALRFITFHDLFQKSNAMDETFLSEYSGNMAVTLDLKIEELNSRASEVDYLALYENAMINAKYLFGDFAFRKCFIEHLEPGSRKQLINKALFVSWSVLLSGFEPELIRDTYSPQSFALPLAEHMTNDSKFFNFMTFGTNGRANIVAAFRKAVSILESEK
jgi:hypothetical protein